MAAASHIADVMAAVRDRIRELQPLFPGLDVEIGHPAQFHPRAAESNHLVTLFVYRIEPDMRAMVSTPEVGLAVRLNTLITVYGGDKEDLAESIGSLELRILSHILRLFVERATLGPVRLRDTLAQGALAIWAEQGLSVEAEPLSLDMEEINHIWTTQGDTPYRTSLAYSFKYGLVTPLKPAPDGPPVLSVELAPPGGLSGPGDIGVDPTFAPAPASPAPVFGALVIRGPGATPTLLPAATVAPAAGNIAIQLLAIAGESASLTLAVQRFDLTTGTWVALPANVATITAIAQRAFDANAVPAGLTVTFANPNAPALIRLTASHPTDPARWRVNPATIAVGTP